MKPFQDTQVFAFTDALLTDPDDLCSWNALSDYLEERDDTRVVRYRAAVDKVRAYSVKDTLAFGIKKGFSVRRASGVSHAGYALSQVLAVSLLRVPIVLNDQFWFKELWERWPVGTRRILTAAELFLLGLLTSAQVDDDRSWNALWYTDATVAWPITQHNLCVNIRRQLQDVSTGGCLTDLRGPALSHLAEEWQNSVGLPGQVKEYWLKSVNLYFDKLTEMCLTFVATDLPEFKGGEML